MIKNEILNAIALNGSVESVEKKGFTVAQIALATRQLLDEGSLIYDGSKIILGQNIVLSRKKRVFSSLEILQKYEIEKINKNDQYIIDHRTFTQIEERVRHSGKLQD